MTFALTPRDLQRMVGLDPRLVAVIKLAAQKSRQPFCVNEGVRPDARQAALYAQGRTRPGKIVTWVKVSNHQPSKVDGLGKAVDLYPIDASGRVMLSQGAPTPAELAAYDEINRAMSEAAGELDTPLRWGADWDCDGKPREKGETDNPHFEIPRGQ